MLLTHICIILLLLFKQERADVTSDDYYHQVYETDIVSLLELREANLIINFIFYLRYPYMVEALKTMVMRENIDLVHDI